MDLIWIIGGILVIGVVAGLGISGVRFIRPKQRALVERFGRYNRFGMPGMVYVIPMIERIGIIDITEQIVTAEPQEIITKDSLNAGVDAQIYFKIKPDEESVKKSQYAVQDYEFQIVSLSRTTLRSLIGGMTLVEANTERDKLNKQLATALEEQVDKWGLEIVRAELKEIKPPADVQEVMNKVVVASNEKRAAVDFASAVATKADGQRQADIKMAEGRKQSSILRAEGEAQAVKLTSEAANRYFKGQAEKLRRIEMAENTLSSNTKVIVPQGSSLVNVMSEAAGIVPLDMNQKRKPKQQEQHET